MNRSLVLAASLLLTSPVLSGCADMSHAQPTGRLGLGLADSALAGGAPRLALQVSNAVLEREPDDVPALLRRGGAYYQLGDYARAAASYRRAATLKPRDVAPLVGLGRVALATNPAEASARFSEALVLQPDNQTALSDRGVAADLSGLHREAQADYRRAIALGQAAMASGLDNDAQNTDLAATEVDLAVSLAITGDAAEAVRILKPIASAPDASPRVRQDLAMALTLDGEPEEAGRLLLTQMSQGDARAAMAGYHALGDAAPAAGGRNGS